MAKPKEVRKALDEQLTIPLYENTKLVKEFEEKNPEKKDDIYRLMDFISYKKIAKIPLSRFSIADVDDYASILISLKWSASEVHNLISYLNSFKDYLIMAYPNEFGIQYLSTLNELRDRYQKPPKKERALNLAQLGCIRKILKDNPKFRKHRYVFEVYFQLGILKNELQYCTPQNLDKSEETWFFKKPDGDKIKLNDFMKQLVTEYQNNQETEYMENNTTVTLYLKQISEELRAQGYFPFDSNLVLDDIKKTRKHFFMTCPNCGEPFESFADNWVLAKAETDSDYHLVCKVCKGEPQDENRSD